MGIDKFGNTSKNKEIRYLKIYTIISGIFSCLYLGIFLVLFFDTYSSFQKLSTLLYLPLPFVVSLVIFLVGSYTNRKYPRITRIIAMVLNIGFLLAHIVILLSLFIEMLIYSPEYTKPREYKKALSSYANDATVHFPEKIPTTAQNIKLLRTSSGFNGDSIFYLKFDAPSEYIQNEIDKYQNIGSEYVIKDDSIKNSNEDFAAAKSVLNNVLDNTEGYTIKVLNSNPNSYSAIAIKDNTIIYILNLD